MNAQTALALIAFASVNLSTFAALPPEANRLDPEHLPTPYSAEEIRDANPPGTVTTYRIDVGGQEPFLREVTFVETESGKAGFSSKETTAQGQPRGEVSSAEADWKDLQRHASYPEETTTISETSFEVTAGKFDCWKYEATVAERVDADGNPLPPTSIQFWFAKELPGPPIKMVQKTGEDVVMMMELISITKPEAE